MNTVYRSHAFLALTALIAGFNYTISKVVMPTYVKPEAIVMVRMVIAAVFFWLIDTVVLREKIDFRRDFIRIALCAFFGVGLNQLLFYMGLNLTVPINASLIMTTCPMLVLIVSAILLNERVTFTKVLGIGIGAIGACLLLLHSRANADKGIFIGDFMIFLNAVCYAVFLVLVKPLLTSYNALTIVKWLFLIGCFVSVPFGYQEFMKTEWDKIPLFALWSLAYIVVFNTIVAYYLNVYVMKYVNASVAGIYIYFQPMLATLIAVSFGKDVLTTEKVASSLLIFAGVFLVSRKSKG